MDVDTLLLADPVIGVQSVPPQKLPITLSERTPRIVNVFTREGHDHVKDGVLVQILFSEDLDLWRLPSFSRSLARSPGVAILSYRDI